eukprot:TRINITY_DN72795_c0_g1_i1.p2 TRINITY_DN72795_c0_g1~~TRINITY_DN72795_c0_g1_i1.p2  ORF type:complete len:359 (+),score=147.18 TRINITY_DN72795_c0_g1_i1:91-1077(+)
MGYDKLGDELELGEASRHYMNEETHTVDTPHGPINVAIEPGCSLEEQKDKPIWLTYHDIGSNHQTCFGSFFALDECQIFKKLFCIVHIDAPGHEEGAKPRTSGLTLTQMAEQVGYVMRYFKFDQGYGRVYAFGVGAGCSVLLRHVTFDVNQGRFAGMILVNGSGSKAGWREWAWNKMVQNTLYMQGWSARAKSAFLHRMFTREAIEDNEDLVEEYSAALTKMIPKNVMQFMDAYNKRDDFSDEIDTISCFDVIQFAGGDNEDFYWHVKELNKMFELGKSTFLRIDECAMLMTEEGPHHIANPIKYWLAGKGYVQTALDIRMNRHPDED